MQTVYGNNQILCGNVNSTQWGQWGSYQDPKSEIRRTKCLIQIHLPR
jgi:hypothetical protein